MEGGGIFPSLLTSSIHISIQNWCCKIQGLWNPPPGPKFISGSVQQKPFDRAPRWGGGVLRTQTRRRIQPPLQVRPGLNDARLFRALSRPPPVIPQVPPQPRFLFPRCSGIRGAQHNAKMKFCSRALSKTAARTWGTRWGPSKGSIPVI